MDSLSPERRSWNMSRIRAKDTRPERLVRSLLHSLGYRFRLNRKDMPGRPDIVLPKYRTAIYVHGCFWHRHGGCSLAYTPKTNLEFWSKKFTRNEERDAEVATALKEAGWKQVVIWECETRDKATLARRLKSSL
jgi:DNA mismatch endonuclease, patch repair protein